MSGSTTPTITPQAVNLQVYLAPGGTPGSQPFTVNVSNYQGVAPVYVENGPAPASGSGGVASVSLSGTPVSTGVDSTGASTAVFSGSVTAVATGTTEFDITVQNTKIGALDVSVTTIVESGTITLGPVVAPTFSTPTSTPSSTLTLTAVAAAPAAAPAH